MHSALRLAESCQGRTALVNSRAITAGELSKLRLFTYAASSVRYLCTQHQGIVTLTEAKLVEVCLAGG